MTESVGVTSLPGAVPAEPSNGRPRRPLLPHPDRLRAAAGNRPARRRAPAWRARGDRHRRERRAAARRRAARSLAAAGIDHATHVVPAGEASKSWDVLGEVVDFVLAGRFERGDAVLALGGGVVGDLAGFAAAITRRGMAFVQVPTSLLAQVDSSVGGKTGVNSPTRQEPRRRLPPAGAGARRHRRARDAFRPRVPRGLRGGREIRPHRPPGLLRLARREPRRDRRRDPELLAHAVATSCEAKAAVVAADERERGVACAAQSRSHVRPRARSRLRLRCGPAGARRGRRDRLRARARLLEPPGPRELQRRGARRRPSRRASACRRAWRPCRTCRTRTC